MRSKQIDMNTTDEKLFLVEMNTSQGTRSTSKIKLKSGCAAHNCIDVVFIQTTK